MEQPKEFVLTSEAFRTLRSRVTETVYEQSELSTGMADIVAGAALNEVIDFLKSAGLILLIQE